ncbi:MAG TPA: Sec-independent protein translocase protein TatB [Acidimicrobiales bacterium]|nr:Sec-independent protein translocase protein TatB [Acidimicrobiales bacterium]
MPTSLGPAEILVILVVALIVLGPKRLPEAGRQVGKAVAEIRKWSQGFQDEIRQAVDFDPKPPSYPTPPPGTDPSPVPMVPAETGPPANGSGTVTTGSHGLVSGPPPADAGEPTETSEPPAGEPPRDQG